MNNHLVRDIFCLVLGVSGLGFVFLSIEYAYPGMSRAVFLTIGVILVASGLYLAIF